MSALDEPRSKNWVLDGLKKQSARNYADPQVEAVKNKVIEYETTKAEPETKKSSCLIDPRTSIFTKYWDLFTSIALVFTAIFTPIEVGAACAQLLPAQLPARPRVPAQPPPPKPAPLEPRSPPWTTPRPHPHGPLTTQVGFIELPEDRWSDPLFLTNRVVDSIFICDAFMQFFLMYKTTDTMNAEGEAWVSDRCKIAKHYLTSAWFYIDALSISVSGFDIFAPTTGPLSRFKGFRAIRVLRLIKLVRLVSVSRIFKRWEMKLSINYAKLSIAQILFGLLFACHLFACLWGLQATFAPLDTWPGPGQSGYCQSWDPEALDADGNAVTCPSGKTCNDAEGHMCESPATMYIYSLYWALATVTSVGYGDVNATAFQPVEQLVCIIIMFSGAIVFAQIVGSFCGLAASLSPDKAQFRADLSDLNDHMANEEIQPELRYRLREYMHQTVHLRRGQTKLRLLNLLSPGLAGEFAFQMNERWLRHVWFLEGVSNEQVLIELSRLLTACVFPNGETTPPAFMYIVTKGRALYGGHVLGPGKTWGTDEVLFTPALRCTFPAIALAYLWTYSISGEQLRDVIRNNPACAVKIRWHQVRLIRRRGLVRAAEERCRELGKRFYGRTNYLYARTREQVLLEDSNERTPLRRAATPSSSPAGGSRGGSPTPPQPPKPSADEDAGDGGHMRSWDALTKPPTSIHEGLELLGGGNSRTGGVNPEGADAGSSAALSALRKDVMRITEQQRQQQQELAAIRQQLDTSLKAILEKVGSLQLQA
jgi:hypothetical protein